MTQMEFELSGLPSPLPKIGPPEGVLQNWYNDLTGSNEELTEIGNGLLRAVVDPQAWYGAAADNFRKEATTMAFASIGLAKGMETVAEALLTYLTAAETYDREVKAALALDQAGLAHDETVRLDIVATGKQLGISTIDTNLQKIWPHLTTVGDTPCPYTLRAYNSPQKIQAVKDLENAKNELALAGLLAASKIATVNEEMRTRVSSDGSTHQVKDPLVGLRELGVTQVTTGQDDPTPVDTSTLPPQLRRELAQEEGDDPYLEPALAVNDIRTGLPTTIAAAKALANKLFHDDGTLGSVAADVAGADSTRGLVGSKGAGKFGDAEGDDLAKASGDTPEVYRVAGKTGISVLALTSDVDTISNTEDTGVHGAVTRVSAVLNAAATGTDITTTIGGIALGTEEVPGLDIASSVVLVGTGVYSLGDSIYDHFHQPHVELP